ncbi:Uncharacterised protein [Mycobacterium tuberculosis]|nr:Uncharacterised protein [Mycobacterium tuberculosis]
MSDFFWKLQKTKHIGYMRSAFPHLFGQLLLRVLMMRNQLPIRFSFFQWIQIFSLQIFDQRDLHQLLIGIRFYDNRHIF